MVVTLQLYYVSNFDFMPSFENYPVIKLSDTISYIILIIQQIIYDEK